MSVLESVIALRMFVFEKEVTNVMGHKFSGQTARNNKKFLVNRVELVTNVMGHKFSGQTARNNKKFLVNRVKLKDF